MLKRICATLFALLLIGGCNIGPTPSPSTVFSRVGRTRLVKSNATEIARPFYAGESELVKSTAAFASLYNIVNVEDIDSRTAVMAAQHKKTKIYGIYLIDGKHPPRAIYKAKAGVYCTVDTLKGHRVILVTFIDDKTTSCSLFNIDTKKMEHIYRKQYDKRRGVPSGSVVWTKRYLVMQEDVKQGSPYALVDLKTHTIERLKSTDVTDSLGYCAEFIASADGEFAASINLMMKPGLKIKIGVSIIDFKRREIILATEETGDRFQHQLYRWTSPKSFLFHRQNAQGRWDLYSLSLP